MTGDVASATDYNAEQNDIASALSDSINKAGTKAMAANLPMGGFKVTGLAAGITNGDSVRYEQVLPSVFQPLDATLTALAALSWASGNALLQFTAADTVSLTLTPSVTSITATNATAATTPAGTLKNTTDNASVMALKVGGGRATPTANDNSYLSWVVNNASSAEAEVARVYCLASTLTAGSESARLEFWTKLSGTMAARLILQPNANALYPATNDALALGGVSNNFSDLFLASGGVINWNNGDVTVTHSSDLLAFAGAATGYTFDAPISTTSTLKGRIPLSTETTGTLTSASANTKILATGGITLPNAVFAAQDATKIEGNGTARTITRGSGVTMYINGVDSATGTLTANGVMLVDWRTSAICVLSGDIS